MSLYHHLCRGRSSCHICGMKRSWLGLWDRMPPVLHLHGEYQCPGTSHVDGICSSHITSSPYSISLGFCVIALSRMTKVRYLGVYMVSSRVSKCSLHRAKCGFYRAANAICGKVGRVSSEEVILQLIKSKCLPILLYCLTLCRLTKNDLNSLDFVINQFLWTCDVNIVKTRQSLFSFDLTIIIIEKRAKKV